jgi:stage V sporulation protein G
MKITEVRIKLMEDPHDRLQAFCSITFDSCFVIRDLKIIQGTKGSFVAMPSRKLTDRCPRCHCKNHLRAQYCNQCGARLDDERALKDSDGRAKLYADIAHPINSECREMIQHEVLQSYEQELVKAQQPDYVCTYDDYGEESYATLYDPDHEDTPVLPRSIIGAGDTSHRIEPAAQSPGAPHHAAAARHRENGAVAHHARERSHEDSFGAGLL